MENKSGYFQMNFWEGSPLEEAQWDVERKKAQALYLDVVIQQAQALSTDDMFFQEFKKKSSRSPGGPLVLQAVAFLKEGRSIEDLKIELDNVIKANQLTPKEAKQMWSDAVEEEVEKGSPHMTDMNNALQKGMNEEAQSN